MLMLLMMREERVAERDREEVSLLRWMRVAEGGRLVTTREEREHSNRPGRGSSLRSIAVD